MAAPNIQSFYKAIPDASAVVLERNDKRDYLAIQNLETTAIRIWVGNNPSFNIEEWLRLPSRDTEDVFIFPQGVQGPVYIAEQGGGAGECIILSSADESLTVVQAS